MPWDFRCSQELRISTAYENNGYIIDNANNKHLELLKQAISNSWDQFTNRHNLTTTSLESAHKSVALNESNNLRLFIMEKIFARTDFNANYYNAAKDLIHNLCGNELAMQKRPGLSINLPHNHSDVLPIHADTWNGVSPFELNIWIPLVNCSDSMCLYILPRQKYIQRLEESKGLLKLNSDQLFQELCDDLIWIPIEYGKVLAFDQSLPHGYSLNVEGRTHWSLNCRFKGLHTPYWDKKLGEYFMPITAKSCTRLGIKYKHPNNWI